MLVVAGAGNLADLRLQVPQSYNGPTVTSVEVHKADRKMYLLHGNQIVESL